MTNADSREALARTRRVGEAILVNAAGIDNEPWPWIGVYQVHNCPIRDANKFLLGCMINYQINTEYAWNSARRLSEEILGDPDHLWHMIIYYSEDEWMSLCKTHKIHRFPQAHRRIWRIAHDLVGHYDGDARQVWTEQDARSVHQRLSVMGFGKQLSRMTVLALLDSQYINESACSIADVKADMHLMRVLSRVLYGTDDALLPTDVTNITRQMHPERPWILDYPLFLLGTEICRKAKPKCLDCYLSTLCDRFSSIGYHDEKGV